MQHQTINIDSKDFGQLAAEHLQNGTAIRITANGRSMHPTIKNGDTLTIAPLNKKKLKRGDIILYRTTPANNLIAHRIIFIRKKSSDEIIYTRGDALGGELEQINPENVLGKVIKVEHNGTAKIIGKTGDRIKGILQALRQSLRHKYIRAKNILQPP
jgi:signal peptidase I